MARGMDDCIVGGQIRIGTGLVPAIKEGDVKIKQEEMFGDIYIRNNE